MSGRKIFVFYWLPLLLALAADFFCSSLTASQLPQFSLPYALKYGHFLGYSLIGFVCCRLLTAQQKEFPNWPKNILITVLFGALWASSDEFHQSFVPGRHPMVSDVILDSSGVLFGALLNIPYRSFRNRFAAKAPS